MKRDWLSSRLGIDFAAVGLVAVCVAGPMIVLHDIWFVVTREWPTLWLYDKVLMQVLAAAAVVFSVASFLIFRPGLPRFAAIIVAFSFASYVVQPLIPLNGYQQRAAMCLARTVGICTLLLLVWSYAADLKAGRAADNE